MPPVNKARKFLVSQNIGENNALGFFRCTKEYYFREQ